MSQTPTVEIKNVKVLGRHTHTTEVRVECRYCDCDYTVITEISEGRHVPNARLEGYTAQPAEEFVVAVHYALDEFEGGKLMSDEMTRICG